MSVMSGFLNMCTTTLECDGKHVSEVESMTVCQQVTGMQSNWRNENISVKVVFPTDECDEMP